MKPLFSHPRFVATAVAGLLGWHQGYTLPNETQLLVRVAPEMLLLTASFGLFALPLLALFVRSVSGPPHYPDWWRKLSTRFDIYWFFGVLAGTLAGVGAYALYQAGSPGGYQVCVFFGSLSPSFLLGSVLERRRIGAG